MSRSRRVVVAIIVGMAVLGACFAVYDSFMSNDTTDHSPATVVSIMPHEGSDQQEMKVQGDDNTYLCSPTNGACKGVDPGDQVSFTFWKTDGKLLVLELKTEIE